jgi:hypothetical protein
VKGWPKDVNGKTLFVCPYCASKDGEIKLTPIESREFVYNWKLDLAFHKQCGNHLALLVTSVDDKAGKFTVLDHHVVNPFATLDKFYEEHSDAELFLETLRLLGKGMDFVIDRVKYVTSTSAIEMSIGGGSKKPRRLLTRRGKHERTEVRTEG